MDNKIRDLVIRLTCSLLLILFQIQCTHAQPQKELWRPYGVSAQLDTANLPSLTRDEKELEVRNKQEEEKRKSDIEKKQAQLDSINKSQSPEYKAMLDSQQIQSQHTVDSILGMKIPTQQKQDKMIEEDKRKMDSSYPNLESDMKKFAENRKVRLVITKDNPKNGGIDGIVNFQTVCIAYLIKDTLRISAGVGFFAGAGVVIKICGNSFSASYGMNADGEDVYKKNLSDKSFQDYVEVAAKNEKLVLQTKPALKRHETVCGYLEADFEPFYEKEDYDKKPVLQNYHAKVFFVCKID